MRYDVSEIEDTDKLINQHIRELENKGHTYHCACRMTFGDGECECYKIKDKGN